MRKVFMKALLPIPYLFTACVFIAACGGNAPKSSEATSSTLDAQLPATPHLDFAKIKNGACTPHSRTNKSLWVYGYNFRPATDAVLYLRFGTLKDPGVVNPTAIDDSDVTCSPFGISFENFTDGGACIAWDDRYLPSGKCGVQVYKSEPGDPFRPDAGGTSNIKVVVDGSGQHTAVSTGGPNPTSPTCPGGPLAGNGHGSCTPLVLNFGNEPVAFLGHGVDFDFFGDATPSLADWVTPQSGFLALAEPDGRIKRGSQLFGSQTRLQDGSLATQGFAALAQYDANGDGVVDAKDAVFGRLVVWFDKNSDGTSQAGEVVGIGSLGVRSLRLDHKDVTPSPASRKGFVGLESTFEYARADGSLAVGKLADVFFPIKDAR
jgi:hypothetical protein